MLLFFFWKNSSTSILIFSFWNYLVQEQGAHKEEEESRGRGVQQERERHPSISDVDLKARKIRYPLESRHPLESGWRGLFDFLLVIFQMESMMTRKGELPDDLACFLQQQKQRQVFISPDPSCVMCTKIPSNSLVLKSCKRMASKIRNKSRT